MSKRRHNNRTATRDQGLRVPMPAAASTPAPVQTGDGLQNVVAGLGTDRDKMRYSEYAFNLIDRGTLDTMYRQSWLAKKIVNIPAEDMTRAWRFFQFDDEDTLEENQFALEDAESKLGVRQKVREALMWARLYGGGALLLGVGGPNDYEKPLDPAKVRKGDLKFIRSLDRWICLGEGQIVTDLASPNFGFPEFYRICTMQGPRVHHSRIIRFIGSPLPYMPAIAQQGWGDSELQCVYETLLSKDTITASIATMMFEANVDVMGVENLADLLSSKEGEQKAIKRFQLAAMMKSMNRMLIHDATGETFEKKSNQFSGLDKILSEFRAEVAGAADIPVTRLFGTGVSGLAATGDNEVRQHYDKISADQESDLRPALTQLDEILVRSTFGAMPVDYRFGFHPLWQMSAVDKATVENQRAQRDKAYYDMGALSTGAIARQLKEDGTYSTMTEEDVELAEELDEQVTEQRAAAAEALINGTGPNNPEAAPTGAGNAGPAAKNTQQGAAGNEGQEPEDKAGQ